MHRHKPTQAGFLGIFWGSSTPTKSRLPPAQSQEPGLSEHCREINGPKIHNKLITHPKKPQLPSSDLHTSNRWKSGVWVQRVPPTLCNPWGAPGRAWEPGASSFWSVPSPSQVQSPAIVHSAAPGGVAPASPGASNGPAGPPSPQHPHPGLDRAPLIPAACSPPAKAPQASPRGAPGSGAPPIARRASEIGRAHV